MTAILALISGLIIGGSDYAGGLASRRDNELSVTTLVQLASGLTALVVAFIYPWTTITTTDIVAGVVAGASGVFSFVAFYRALSTGAMGVIAPLTAVIGAVVPAAISIAGGEELSTPAMIGLAIAVVGILLVSRPSGTAEATTKTPPSALLLSVVTGLGFSVFFLALARTSSDAGVWPLVAARAVSVPLVCAASLVVNKRALPLAPARRLAVLGGINEMLANVMILIAIQRGPVAIATVFGAFYPISTAALAYIFLGERLGRVHLAGATLAVCALPLVAL